MKFLFVTSFVSFDEDFDMKKLVDEFFRMNLAHECKYLIVHFI